VARDKLKNVTVRLPVLDRLIDDNPGGSDAPLANHRAFEVVMEAVRRDLQSLLNSRQAWIDDTLMAAEYASRSITAFGLPDFSVETFANSESLGRLRSRIESAVANFEPRLARVVVTPEPPRPHERHVRFRIDALLRVDPIQEPVTFDTVLRGGGEAEVKAG
jgi:type VI secretion system protein ImpF